MKFDIPILYRDEDVVGISKPSGLLSIPDRYNHSLPSVASMLERAFKKVYTIHRLDKQTSGVMVWALNEHSHKKLNIQFEKREVNKYYHVLIRGTVIREEGVIDLPLTPHPSGDGRMVIHKKGKPSRTRFKLLAQYRNFALVEAEILTGRTHQIRVHFQAAGMPLAVDTLYGEKSGIFLSEFKRKYRHSGDKVERPLISRLTLHASKLVFKHPATNIEIMLEADYPKDFKAVVNQLEKWN
jgi:23S rRNA pseudouridine955/2504/2580 synthase/23S rRNA pseudouridine1911/1915/1917 synthase